MTYTEQDVAEQVAAMLDAADAGVRSPPSKPDCSTNITPVVWAQSTSSSPFWRSHPATG